MSDYELDEVRRIRKEISREHGDDVRKLGKYYQELEAELRRQGKHKFKDGDSVYADKAHPRAG